METLVAPVQSTSTEKPDFGSGPYSNVMAELYRDLMRLCGLSPEQAEKVARQYASDHGRNMKNAERKATVGRITLDGKMALADTARVKGVTATPALTAGRLVIAANKFGQEGARFIKFEMPTPVMEWINA